ncbi:ion channel [soil metagenome]
MTDGAKAPLPKRRTVTAEARPSRIDRGLDVIRVGGKVHPLTDAYYWIMRAPWLQTIALILGAYLGINLIFAIAFGLVGGVTNVRSGHPEDYFFFSVETFATIGYGTMAPESTLANVLMMMEAFTGILASALTTGLVFSKFARPTARVLFSNVMLISERDRKKYLVFRVANARGNQIVQAELKVVANFKHTTEEGESLRRLVNLDLVRADSALFALTWTAMHPIDERSPLFGKDAAWRETIQFGLIVTLMGHDGTLGQTVHARHSWDWEQIVEGGQFSDVIQDHPDGTRTLDLTRFQDYTLPE